MSSQNSTQQPTLDWTLLDEPIAFRFVQGILKPTGMTNPRISIMSIDPLTLAGRAEQVVQSDSIITPILLQNMRAGAESERQAEQLEMHNICFALGAYLQSNIRALDIEQHAQSIVDFARESRNNPTTSTASLLTTYKTHTTQSGKNFFWLDGVLGMPDSGIQIVLRGIIAFANSIKNLEAEKGDEMMSALMLGFKPVVASCATCMGECDECFGPGGHYEHMGDAARAQGTAALNHQHSHGQGQGHAHGHNH